MRTGDHTTLIGDWPTRLNGDSPVALPRRFAWEKFLWTRMIHDWYAVFAILMVVLISKFQFLLKVTNFQFFFKLLILKFFKLLDLQFFKIPISNFANFLKLLI